MTSPGVPAQLVDEVLLFFIRCRFLEVDAETIADRMRISKRAASRALIALCALGELERVGWGKYRLA